MKFSPAIVLLVIGATDARRVRRAGTRRRAQTDIAPVEVIPDADSDAIDADNFGNCDTYTATGFLSQIFNPFGPANPGVFSVHYTDEKQTVNLLRATREQCGPGGCKSLDITTHCFPLEAEICRGGGGSDRRAQAITEDKNGGDSGGCPTRKTIQCLTVLPGDEYVFELSEEIKYCYGPGYGRKLGFADTADTAEIEADMGGRRGRPNISIEYTDSAKYGGGKGCYRRGLEEDVEADMGGRRGRRGRRGKYATGAYRALQEDNTTEEGNETEEGNVAEDGYPCDDYDYEASGAITNLVCGPSLRSSQADSEELESNEKYVIDLDDCSVYADY